MIFVRSLSFKLAKYVLFTHLKFRLDFLKYTAIVRKRYHGSRKLIEWLTVMPKTSDNKIPLEETRFAKRIAAMDRNRPAAEICLQVLGNGAKGSTRALHVFTDQWRYLFNCGEGTQRLACEYKIRLGKLEHVFITHGSWENIGGLPGFMLTIQEIGVPKINLHGPNGIEKLFDMTKGFMLTEDIEIDKRDVSNRLYEDNIMSVNYVPLYGRLLHKTSEVSSEPVEDAAVDYYDNQRTTKMQNLSDGQSPVAKKPKLSDFGDDRDTSIAYICRCTNKPGMLLLEKCVDYGVPPGPMLGRLKNGEDITLNNGTIVKSVDVLAPETPGPVFIVIECPSIEFLDSLLGADEFAEHQAGAKRPQDLPALVVHFTPTDVTNTEKYQEWIQRFDPSTEHLFINDSNVGPSSFAIHRGQHKLNLINPVIFPLLKEEMSKEHRQESSAINVIPCETLLRYQLRPFTKADSASVVSVNVQDFHDECKAVSGLDEVLSELKTKLFPLESSTNGSARQYPEVIFLGTGSSIPSKVRNTSAILLNLCPMKSILLDCAEGTFTQFYRYYGMDTDRILQNVRAIFISHLHADHHLGLIQFLKQRRNAFCKSNREYLPIALLAPPQIMIWLQQYHRTFEPILDDFRLFPNLWFNFGTGTNEQREYRDLLNDLEMKKVEAVPVRHCMHAFGIALIHKDDWKIVYSGDTMPCESLVNAGMDCDLLIHEATMEDSLAEEARMKKHSTTSEAIQQGIKMKAKFTLLTHFSQRYAKVPIFTDNFGSNVGIAFDNMRVNLDDLHILPHLVPALITMFAEEYEDMQDKTAKKILQKSKQEAKVKEHIQQTVAT